MVDELREMFQGGRQTEGVTVIPVEEGKSDAEFEQQSVYPLLDLERILDLSLA